MTTMTRPTLSPRFILGCIAFAALGTLTLMALASVMSGSVRITYDDTPWALIIHVGTVIPALLLGGPVLLMKKGTRLHKALGRIWAMLMMTTAISSFWLQGLVGSIGPIHVFSVITLISIPRAIWAIRKGDVRTHQQAMTGPFIGLIVAGLFSFVPGRMMGQLVAGLF